MIEYDSGFLDTGFSILPIYPNHFAMKPFVHDVLHLTPYRPLKHFRALAAILALLTFGTAEAGVTADLPPGTITALKEAGIPLRSLSVLVQGVDAAQPLITHNAKQAMNPASAMKLVTTYAGLEVLGPAYTWKTEALVDSPQEAGKLDGNLYLRGSGDPRLALEQFWLLLRQLRARGVTDIAGDLVLDRSAFSLPPHNSAEFDNEPLRPYNAGPDALLINLKSVRLTLQADPTQKSVTVFAETPSDDLRISNRLTFGTEACGDWREKLKVAVNGDTIDLVGSYSGACGEKALHLSPWNADQQVERLFRRLWRELGGNLRGQVRSGTTPHGARSLATHESPTLGEVIREVNKYSNNVMARQLFLSLSPTKPATADAARRRIQNWLDEKGLNIPELQIDNGSGLSRSERISATGLGELLLAAWRSSVMPELMASLPVAGVDGTLKKRLGDTATGGRAHLKTGYLEGVRAIAGYVLDASGKRWVVVCLINDPKARLGKPAMDALVRWVAER